MNVILADCEEFRCVRGKKNKEEKQEKRTMGLLLLRGETIVTMTLEGPPPTEVYICVVSLRHQFPFERLINFWGLMSTVVQVCVCVGVYEVYV